MKNFVLVRTSSNYPFEAIIMDGNKYVIKECSYLDCTKHKSLTNNIEEVLDHLVMRRWRSRHDKTTILEEFSFFQIDDDGLFRLHFNINNKYVNVVTNVKWEFITKDFDTFKVLYGKN